MILIRLALKKCGHCIQYNALFCYSLYIPLVLMLHLKMLMAIWVDKVFHWCECLCFKFFAINLFWSEDGGRLNCITESSFAYFILIWFLKKYIASFNSICVNLLLELLCYIIQSIIFLIMQISILLLTPYFSSIIMQLQIQPQEFVTGFNYWTCFCWKWKIVIFIIVKHAVILYQPTCILHFFGSLWPIKILKKIPCLLTPDYSNFL